MRVKDRDRDRDQAVTRSQKGRAKQLAEAQGAYRRRMRSEGYQRFQEWLPKGTISRLKELCEILGVPRREAIERLVSAAHDGNIELVKDAT